MEEREKLSENVIKMDILGSDQQLPFTWEGAAGTPASHAPDPAAERAPAHSKEPTAGLSACAQPP